MKKISMLTTALMLLMCFACSSNNNNDPEPEPEAFFSTKTSWDKALSSEAQTAELFVTANVDWSASSDQPWCTLRPSGGVKGVETKITLKIEANTGLDERTAVITLKSGSRSATVVVQQSATSVLTVSPSTLTAGGVAQNLQLQLEANCEWKATPDVDWISVIPDNGKTSATVVVALTANSSQDERTGNITFSYGDGQTATVAVKQLSDAVVVPDGYRLVWCDEFNTGDVPGSDWTHEVKSSGWVNNELQNYVKGEIAGKRVTEVSNGTLKIDCFKHDNKVYSGRIYAHVNEGWLYGWFEARIKLPKGKGTWPAFWMMPSNNNFSTNPWPNCGEIDIMEEVGADPNVVSSSIHCEAYNHVKGTQKTASKNIGTAESEFHVYACEWTPEYLRFFVDGKELMTFRNEGKGASSWPFTYNFYPILNLAWGGDWGGYKGVDESALPVTMEVDYVRVFQKAE